MNGGATYYTPIAEWSRTEFEAEVAVTTTSVELLGPGGAEMRRTEGVMFWDDFGNPTYDFAHMLGGSTRLAQFTYDNLTADWQIGLLRQSLESVGPLGALPAPREATFDHDERGRLQRTTIEPNDPALRRRTVYHRNSDGLVEAIQESVSGEPVRTTHFAYDAQERMFLRAAWNDLGHARRSVTHPALGLPLVTEDENGVQVRRRYDTFGRVVEILPDGGAPVTIAHAADTRADPAHPHGLAITEKSAGAETTTYVDERGRTKETRSLGFDGKTIVRKVDYNAFGQPVRVYRPGFGAASLLFTETTFDTLGRVVAVERPDGERAETDYGMFEVVRWGFDKRPSILRFDADGHVVESTRFLALDHSITTRFDYGDFGQLTDVWDAEDNHTHLAYDKLGRRTLLDDPDQGISTYQYNGFGELRQSDDNDPTTPPVVLHRDMLGRVTTRTDGDGATTYAYDTPGALGNLWKMTSPDGVETELSYDGFGRPWKTAWTLATPGGAGLGDGTYEIERAYDGFGRLSELRYPEVPQCAGCPRFTARYTYTQTGYLHRVEDARQPAAPSVIWEVAQRDADDLLVKSRWAPGVAAFGKESPEETRGYDPVLGRLESIVTKAAGGEIFHLDYGYDFSGNVTSRADPVIGRVETFGYDPLDRLKTWTLETGGQTRKQSYDYDDLDNLLSVNEDGAPVLEHTYGVLVPGAPKQKPHALETLSGAVAHTYAYDTRGRQIEGGNRGITWTEFDLPHQITHPGGATGFDYDAAGNRVRKTRLELGLPVASTITLGGLYERREDTQGGTIEHVFYVVAEGGAVAQITYEESDGEETARYLQHDGLGSIAVVLDGAGIVHDRRFFEPFGQRIEADGGVFSGGMGGVELGFTGHRHDGELGLVDMRGRVYDPLQKHFLTPDPILGAPLSGQDLNRYSYGWNNPLTITDPTGLQEAQPGFQQLDLSRFMLDGIRTVGDGLRSLFGAGPSPAAPPPATTPSPPKSDGAGAQGPTGPAAQPSPQEVPPATEAPKKSAPPPDDYHGFVPYNREAQRQAGFVAGAALGYVPFAPLVAHALINGGILPPATPEFLEGMARGEIAGALLSLRPQNPGSVITAELNASTAAPLTAGAPAASPLSLVPDGTAVMVLTGGILNVAGAIADMTMALSKGGDGNGTSASGTNYRETFFSAHPELRGEVVVHHAIEQQILKRYPGLFTEAEIHALGNLRGIPKSANPDLHLSQLRKAWNEFYRTNATPTKQQVLDFAQKLDQQMGASFVPPR